MTFDVRIKGGRVVDPWNGVNDVRDLWIADGKIVAAPSDPDARAIRTIDTRGYVIMAGGVDVHCHIAGSKVNAARAFRPEESRANPRPGSRGLRSGTTGINPSTFATGYLYAGLGYTTALDASIPPLSARHAHQEFADTPLIDKAFLVLLGNNHFLMDQIAAGDENATRDAVAWLLDAAKGYGVKVVNPGGIEKWKDGTGKVVTLDDPIESFGVTPRAIMTSLARAVDSLGLPHPMHLHGLNLGLPGNAATTLETLRALDGHRVHLAHVQFHSYGPAEEKTGLFSSAAEALAEAVNSQEHVTVDVGQVMFGETTSMTADGAVGHFLARLTGRKWVNIDVEMETGCGVVPITYSDRNQVHALQWAIGLEWFLRVTDPWKVALSTDHPNGGSFLSYPKLIALLMDRDRRVEAWKNLPEGARARSGLGELDREYTLDEIAVVTRAAPARMMGLAHKGHLGEGADADITIYAPHDDKETMFALPRYVLKAGVVIVDGGEVRESTLGRTLHVAPGHDPAIAPRIEAWINRDYSIRAGNYPVRLDEVAEPLACPCEGGDHAG
jgi:formylmethanofuran dehydrogenase subunit A